MKRGFHAIWFQLSALAACPLHGCSLLEHCAHCGAGLGPYRFTRQLFSDPYACSECGSPFSGNPCDYRAQVEFFREAEDVDDAFEPLEQWLASASSSLLFLDLPNRGRKSVDSSLIKIRTLDGVIRRIAAPPRSYVLTEVRDVALRSWEVRLTNSRQHQLLSKYGVSLWGGRATYQALVRRITRYVAMRTGTQQVADSLVFEERDRASLFGWCPESLALVMLRCAFEEPHFLAWNAPLRGIRLRHGMLGNVSEASMLGNVLTRAACRAVVVATFLGLCDLAEQHVANGYLCRADLNNRPGHMVVLAGCVSDGVQCGVVALPADRMIDVLLPATGADTLMRVLSKINKVFSMMGGA